MAWSHLRFAPRGQRVMEIGIRPTVDFAFKLLLGSSEHTGITVHFLNAVLQGSPRIQQVTIPIDRYEESIAEARGLNDACRDSIDDCQDPEDPDCRDSRLDDGGA